MDLFIVEQKDKRRARENLEDTLVLAGVARDFSALNVESIYEVLLKLPEGQIDEKRARGFYRQVIQNMELQEWEERNTKYQEFLSKGKVLAEYRGEKHYIPIQEVYYLDDRTICNDVLYHFPILQLERRKGKEKVEMFLGVKPFANIIFKIQNTPKLHPLHKEFEKDMKNFLPYVYCYRLEKDGQLADLSRLKGLEIFLCSELDAANETNGETHSTQLVDYEFVEVDKGRKVYLKLSPNKHGRIEDLRNDFKFCETVANMITGLLDVEGNYKDFRDLYGKDDKSHRETIKSDFEDQDLELLNKSRTYFQQFIDHRCEFWKSVFFAMGLTFDPVYEFDEILKRAGSEVSVSRELIIRYSGLLDYGDLESESNALTLINLFKELGIDIEAFNSCSEWHLNIISHHKTVFRQLIDQYESNYASYLYNKLSSSTVEKKRHFLSLKQRYRQLNWNFNNSVHVDVNAEFFKMIEVDLDTLKVTDIDQIYFENKRVFIEANSMSETDSLYFFDDPKHESLVYFKEFDTLKELLIQYRVMAASEVTASTIEEIEETLDLRQYQITDLDTRKPGLIIGSGTTRNGGGASIQKKLRQSDANGLLGEKLAYAMLKEEYGKDNVIWVSENAKKAGVNANGRDGLGYDIKVKNKLGQDVYVEVKSTSGIDLLFFISQEELEFAEKKGDNHFFLLITDLKNEKERNFSG